MVFQLPATMESTQEFFGRPSKTLPWSSFLSKVIESDEATFGESLALPGGPKETTIKLYQVTRWFQIFYMFNLTSGKKKPFWLVIIFQRGWNHQLDT